MAYQTVVAAFDTPAHAQAAVEALKAGGFHADDISLFDKNRVGFARARPVAAHVRRRASSARSRCVQPIA